MKAKKVWNYDYSNTSPPPKKKCHISKISAILLLC